MAGLEETLRMIQGAWTGFSFSQKITISGIAIAVIVSLLTFGLWLREPSYAVLFSDLDIATAGDVAGELEQMGEDHKVTRGGTTILVPADKVAELRIALASSGAIPSGSVGYEIFDNNEIGVTDFVQKLNLRRALEGELSRTISSLKAVEKARVHVVFPKESIYSAEKREATASVVLDLKQGNALSQSQIQGITNLVSYSVDGLNPENVTVINQFGNTLTGSVGEESHGLTNAQIDIKKGIESYLAGKAEDMLSVVLGSGRSVVRVDADIDYRKTEVVREVFDPNTVVRSEQTTEESNTQEGSTSATSVTNYDINKTVEKIVGGGGGIKSMSVAVFVDGHYEHGGEGGESVYTPLEPGELNEIEEIVKGAVGFDPSRNDMIKVVNLRFHSGETTGEIGLRTPLMEWLPDLITKVASVSILIFLFLLFRKHLGRLFSGSVRGFAPFTAAKVGPGVSVPEVKVMDRSIEDRSKEVSMREPEQVVKLVKTWMTE